MGQDLHGRNSLVSLCPRHGELNSNFIRIIQRELVCEVARTTLLDVPELWMPVAQLVYLFLCAALEPMVTLASCSELVLIDAVRDTK